ncbi:MAG TPA: chromate resistance protein ChrB domain-containing protein [Gemmatimonadales bacterium]|jgi:hypothetical protein
MNDSTESQGRSPGWLLLIHRLPPKPDYLRVKVRRRLQRLGAVALKNSVYALPDSEDALEDFQWLAREIEAEGAEAIICQAHFVRGISEEELRAMFESQQSGRAEGTRAAVDRVDPGQTWVTREGVKVDRMASAWLIRRFIDPQARFRFVPARGYRPEPGEIRFDMFEAEYSHVGDACTFETLVARFGLGDRALKAIGEIVHDIDCKDQKFDREQTAGVATLIEGVVVAHGSDAERLARGEALFGDLYAYFAKQAR